MLRLAFKTQSSPWLMTKTICDGRTVSAAKWSSIVRATAGWRKQGAAAAGPPIPVPPGRGGLQRVKPGLWGDPGVVDQEIDPAEVEDHLVQKGGALVPQFGRFVLIGASSAHSGSQPPGTRGRQRGGQTDR